MKPIINPLFIYLSGILPIVGIILIVAGVSILFISTFFFVFWILDNCYSIADMNEEEKKYVKLFKKIIFISSIITFVGIIIPNQKTMYAMYAASFTTPNNIEFVGDGLKETIDYIFEKADDLKNGREVESNEY